MAAGAPRRVPRRERDGAAVAVGAQRRGLEGRREAADGADAAAELRDRRATPGPRRVLGQEPVADDQRAAPDLEAHVGERRRARVFDEQRPPPRRRVEVAVRVRRAPGRSVAERVQRVVRFAADVDVAEDRVVIVLLLWVRQGCCCCNAPVCNVTQLSVVVCRLRSAGTGCVLCTRSVDICQPKCSQKCVLSGWGQLAV